MGLLSYFDPNNHLVFLLSFSYLLNHKDVAAIALVVKFCYNLVIYSSISISFMVFLPVLLLIVADWLIYSFRVVKYDIFKCRWVGNYSSSGDIPGVTNLVKNSPSLTSFLMFYTYKNKSDFDSSDCLDPIDDSSNNDEIIGDTSNSGKVYLKSEPDSNKIKEYDNTKKNFAITGSNMLFSRKVVGFNLVKNFSFCTRKLYSTTEKLRPDELAFVFDIDGVIMRGSKPIIAATKTLNTLKSLKIPFILLTNGGGKLEKSRTKFLSEKLRVDLSPLQIVQSHTPFKCLINKFSRVLVVGGPEDKSRYVAVNYGFKDVIIPADVIRANNAVWPYAQYTDSQLLKWSFDNERTNLFGPKAKPIECILVFNDSRDMGSDIQIILELLNSQDGFLGTKRNFDKNSSKPSIPIYFSNNDFVWANDYQLPRFGQGALKIMIDSLYKHSNGVDFLESTVIGKPEKVTYDYAHHALIDWRKNILQEDQNHHNNDLEQVVPELGKPPVNSPLKKVFMVGDNPESDIIGTNNYGWESILVRTGVFKDQDFIDDKAGKYARPTIGIFDDVDCGVNHILNHYLS
ncbi:hypothetical protein PACTADRAFT_2155 [Pachysolen tannophilus NRRL Y-2460]|uniref:TIGR01456 family HAD hydrolase n=1 Tax=Pachysolen tannophilus NRRL Y-2460 TaxID=669874 RepID=A0A1E4TW15_PACTA|nr:hypothetical protein PACTADRAFT_2155 [Pachysolen tannophilus NRRL Y-2460]